MKDFEPEWRILAEKLRQELHQHGALLKMLEDQRKVLIGRDPDGITTMNAQLEEQCHLLTSLRKDREEFTSRVGSLHGLSNPITARELTACFPPEARPLVEALLVEVNRLITQTRTRLEQNQALFRRAQEMGEHLLFALQPRQAGTTYTAGGSSRRGGQARRMNYNRFA